MCVSGSRYLGDGATDGREILHDGIDIGPAQVFFPFGPQIPKFYREYLAALHMSNGA